MLDVALCKNNTAELEAELTSVTVWDLVLGGIFQSISIIWMAALAKCCTDMGGEAVIALRNR